MIAFFKYLFTCRNRELYTSLSREYETPLPIVYKLAHGRKARNSKEHKILKRLKEQNIISEIGYY